MQAADKESFRRAFAAATVHDMFNWLTVVLMVVLEVSTGSLEAITKRVVASMNLDNGPANFTAGSIVKTFLNYSFSLRNKK